MKVYINNRMQSTFCYLIENSCVTVNHTFTTLHIAMFTDASLCIDGCLLAIANNNAIIMVRQLYQLMDQ